MGSEGRTAPAIIARRRQRKIKRQQEATETLRIVADRLAAWDHLMAQERAQRTAARRQRTRQPVAT